MEAKDTAITKDTICGEREKWQDAEDEVRDFEEWLCQAQAEISFPLGKQEGIREMVEWIKSRPIKDVYDDGAKRMRLYEIGDTELKEWGL